MTPHGYYLNSLICWRSKFQHEQKTGDARLKRMAKAGHPDAEDQARMLRMRQGWLDQIESEIRAISLQESSQP